MCSATDFDDWACRKSLDRPSDQAGLHVCQIYREESERSAVLKRFLLCGMRAGEQAYCFSEHINQRSLAGYFADYGLSVSELCASGVLGLSDVQDAYLANQTFDPDRLLDNLRELYWQAINEGFPAARVIGEMPPQVQTLPGASRLIEYENRVTELQRECPLTAMCQYDARSFDGATLLDILRVHPFILARGEVITNPFFIAE